MEKEPTYNPASDHLDDHPITFEVAPSSLTDYEGMTEPVSIADSNDAIKNRAKNLDLIRSDIGNIFDGEQAQKIIPDEVEQQAAPYEDDDAMKDLNDFGLSTKDADNYLNMQYEYSRKRGTRLKLSREDWLDSRYINDFFESLQLPVEKREAFSQLTKKIYDGLYPQVDEKTADQVVEGKNSQQEKTIDHIAEERESRREKVEVDKEHRDVGRIISRLEEANDQITRLTHKLIAFADYDNGRLANEGVIRKTRQDLDNIEHELRRSGKLYEDLDPVIGQAAARLRNIDLQSWTLVNDVVTDIRSVSNTVRLKVDELKRSKRV